MLDVFQTEEFTEWLDRLRDRDGRRIIVARIKRLSFGNAGDVASVGDGISEMRVHHGPGYRLYFIRRGRVVVVLLCGGDKAFQSRDIKRAKAIAAELEELP